MPRRDQAAPLSLPISGINRLAPDSDLLSSRDALNVWQREVDIARRPAFVPIAHATPYLLPAGKVTLATESAGGLVTILADRAGTFFPDSIGGLRHLWVGCSVPFNGIFWQHFSEVPAAANATGNAQLWLRYRDAAGALHTVYSPVDTTRATRRVNDNTEFSLPLHRDGYMHWSLGDLTSWALSDRGGVSAYWMAIDLADVLPILGADDPESISMPCSAGQFTIERGGVRCFLTPPVASLHDVHTRGGSPCLIVGSDFPRMRSIHPSAGLGLIRNLASSIQPARLVLDEGAGMIGQPNTPLWGGGSAPEPLSVAGQLAKLLRSYSWIASSAIEKGQFQGSPILTVAPSAGGDVDRVPLGAGWNTSYPTNLENCRARITVQPGIGPAVGEEVEIHEGDGNTILIYPNWSVALNGAETIQIRRPNPFIRTMEGHANYEAVTTAANNVAASAQPFAGDMTNEDATYVNFELGQESYFALKNGRRWCWVYDPDTGRAVGTNGANGLLEWDGNRLRPFRASFDDTEGVAGAYKVRAFRGLLSDANANSPEQEGTLLHRTPPDGDYLTMFAKMYVLARGHRVYWSAPQAFNDIWPLTYNSAITDSNNKAITGIATVGNKLAVFTPNSIHVATAPSDGQGTMVFTPTIQDAGFMSHHAVAQGEINGVPVLIGPSANGIMVTDGVGARFLVSNWRQIEKDGVNDGLLGKSSGAFLSKAGLYVLAYPSRGSDTMNRVALVNTVNGATWVWEAPYGGVTSIAKKMGRAGKEFLIFGHADGTISTLADAVADRGSAIEGFFRFAPVGQIGQPANWTGLELQMLTTGSNVEVRSYMETSDGVEQAIDTFPVPPYETEGEYDSGDVFDTALYASERYDAIPSALPLGTVSDLLEIEVRGSGFWRCVGGVIYYGAQGPRKAL